MKITANDLKARLGQSTDVQIRELTLGDRRAELVCYSSMVSETLIRERILLPFIHSEDEASFLSLLNVYGAKETDEAEVAKLLADGHGAVLLADRIIMLPLGRKTHKDPLQTSIDNTILGSKYALSEILGDSLNQIRSRYPNPELVAEPYQVGTESKLDVFLLYDSSKVKQRSLGQVRKRLNQLHVDIVTSSGDLLNLMNDTRLALFPNMLVTERADRISLALAEGKFILLVKGSPTALIAPVGFHDFMISLDDINYPPWLSFAIIFMRYASLVVSLFLPALYITIVSYNPEIFRMQLTLSIAGSRAAVPYPSFIEVLIMLFIMEALIESSIRLPRFIGSTATTVGGLILGQAAQQAGLVSSIMIIVTSTVAIANFVIPGNSMSFVMRFVKYPMILLASLFGILGISLGIFLLIMMLCSLSSFGEPYLKLPERLLSIKRYPKRKGKLS
jgi:spore germination protein KA